jgi:hypothetical protein
MESAGRVVRTGEWVAGSAAPGLGAIGVFVPAGSLVAAAAARRPYRPPLGWWRNPAGDSRAASTA